MPYLLPSSNYDTELARFFTGAEYLRELLHSRLVTPTLPKRILIIHGVGGVGKSSLLQMLHLDCKKEHTPVAFASGGQAKSAVEILSDWMKDLKADGVTLTSFDKTLVHYHMIQAQVWEQSKKAQKSKAAELTKDTAKRLMDMAGSTIPVVGPLVTTLGGIGVEALANWFRDRDFTKPDIELILDPTKKLTDDFLNDLERFASKKRVVLTLDTFEQLTTLWDWVSEMAQRLHGNVLLVIACRKVPNWDRQWQGWTTQAQIEELKPMSEVDMRQLVRLYYATMRDGAPNSRQVEAIVQFARGLPIVVTTAVRLWVEYGVEDFAAVKSEVLADLTDRLLEGVHEKLGQLVKAASTLRWFNQSSLSTVLGEKVSDAEYKELRLFTFVRPHVEGYALHDTVREIIDDYLKVHNPDYHRELHERAARHFQLLIGSSNSLPGISENWQKLTLEEVYHLLQVDADAGLDLLSILFRHGIIYLRYQFCHALIDDAESLSLNNLKSAHRLRHFSVHLTATELSWAYVSKDDLQTLVLESDLDVETEWEVFLNYGFFLNFTGKYDNARKYYEKSLEALRAIGQEESIAGCLVLTTLAGGSGRGFVKALAQRAVDISKKIGEPLAGYEAYTELGHTYFAQGDYAKAEELWHTALEIAKRYQNDVRIADAYNKLAQGLIAVGKLSEAEDALSSAIQSAKRLPDTLGGMQDKEMYIKRHLGILHHARGDLEKAIKYLFESAQTYRKRRSTNGLLRTLVLLADCLYEANRHIEFQALSTEIDSIAERSGMGDWIARWQTLQGHIHLDQVSEQHPMIDDAVDKYEKALTVALDWNIQTLDSTVHRICWKLRKLIHTKREQVALSIIKNLTGFWRTGQINGVYLVEIEQERRKHDGATTELYSISQIITKLESIETQRLIQANLTFWEGL